MLARRFVKGQGCDLRRGCRREEVGLAELLGLDQVQLLWMLGGLVVGFFVFGLRT